MREKSFMFSVMTGLDPEERFRQLIKLLSKDSAKRNVKDFNQLKILTNPFLQNINEQFQSLEFNDRTVNYNSCLHFNCASNNEFKVLIPEPS